MRLIDADELIKEYTECKKRHNSASSDWIFDAIILDLKSAPTITPEIVLIDKPITRVVVKGKEYREIKWHINENLNIKKNL